MKIAQPPSRGLLSYLPSVVAMSFGIVATGLLGQAHAEAVDSELVLLVDVSQSGLNKKDFDSVLGSYASALSSSQVLESIQAGNYGRIAVSLMLFGGSNVQQVGIPWMLIGSASDAAKFSALAGNVSKPNAAGFPAVGTALTAAAASFGTETGGKSNGFESALQIIDVAAAVEPNSNSRSADAAAKQGALSSGVDLINAIALGNKATAIAAYYTTQVIGSTVPGVAAKATTSSVNTALAATLATGLSSDVKVAITAVPEPATAFGIGIGMILMLIRRRRN